MRPRMRAHAFMHLQGRLSDQIDYLSKGLATDNWIILTGMPDSSLERCLTECKTAVTWFPDYKVLDALYAEIKPSPVLKLPRPSIYEMGRLIEDGEKILAKLRAMAGNKNAR
jgi:hypothetical protein